MECYCIALRRAANGISELYDQFLSPIRISVTQYSLLSNLARLEPCSTTELAAQIGLERTTLTRTLKPLLNMGLAADEAEAGRRSHRLRVTPSGRDVLARGDQLWLEAQEEIERRLGRKNAEDLKRILSLLGEAAR